MNGERLARLAKYALGLSPSSKATWGLSPEIVRTIYYRDRAYRSVRFVRLGTGDEEARRAKDARRCPAQRRSEGMRAHRTVSLHSALILAGCSPRH
ncbi:hypothetical protein EVAR_65700_1 [Eumeta japonica]|uniref:Uncharacterized protein n=1 Tax=Eumeta variegata TaxID=151549 RepID=A0A4C2A887_EUMVA|nr:hypothetical protein EVAR_65700_1 [Eumeta japonica]